MFIYVLLGMVIVMFLKLDGHNILSCEVTYRYQRWKELKSAVATQHKTALTIFYHSFVIVCRLLYLSFIQYMNNSVVKVGRNKYIVRYLVAGKCYTMMVKVKRGPSPVIQVIDDNEEDVTDTILPYMGPAYNWHGSEFEFSSITNSESLTFNLADKDPVSCKRTTELMV